MDWEAGSQILVLFLLVSFCYQFYSFSFFITDRMTAACHKLSGTSHCLVSAGKKLQCLTSGVQATCVLSAVPRARCTF